MEKRNFLQYCMLFGGKNCKCSGEGILSNLLDLFSHLDQFCSVCPVKRLKKNCMYKFSLIFTDYYH